MSSLYRQSQTDETSEIRHNPVESNTELIRFLRVLAEELETGTISERKRENILELYISCQLSDLSQTTDEMLSLSTEFNDEELFRFIILGWYFYRCILSENRQEQRFFENSLTDPRESL